MGLSRNKVAVSEGAAGSPPFYGECVTPRTRELRIFDWFDERPKDDCCSIFRIKSDSEEKVGVFSAKGPPVPIPNTEVKLCCADNTLRATAREDRSMPTSSGIRKGSR